jgi:methylated-DNA-protein-cysteine methyltransferase related protein
MSIAAVFCYHCFMTTFKQNVIVAVKRVPRGRVVSYGQVAAFLGSPRAARQVGWVLHTLDGKEDACPWWRVVNNEGRISIRGNLYDTAAAQKKLLEREGVKVGKDYHFDMEKYRFRLA